MKRRLFIIAIILCTTLAPLIISAHVKWFTEEPAVKEDITTILSPFFISFALLVAIVLAAIPQILPRIPVLQMVL